MSQAENRRAFLKNGVLAASAAIAGASLVGNRLSGQTVAMRPISLPELPPKPAQVVTAKLLPGFVQSAVSTSGATIPVVHKDDTPTLLLLHGHPATHAPLH